MKKYKKIKMNNLAYYAIKKMKKVLSVI